MNLKTYNDLAQSCSAQNLLPCKELSLLLLSLLKRECKSKNSYSNLPNNPEFFTIPHINTLQLYLATLH